MEHREGRNVTRMIGEEYKICNLELKHRTDACSELLFMPRSHEPELATRLAWNGTEYAKP
jgi:hypothetical protein